MNSRLLRKAVLAASLSVPVLALVRILYVRMQRSRTGTRLPKTTVPV